MKCLTPFIGLLLLNASAFAQETTNGYIGVGLGIMDYSQDRLFFGNELTDSTSTWKIYGGYNFSDYLGIEASYGAPTEVSVGTSWLGPMGGLNSYSYNGDYTITTVKLVAYLPLSWGKIFGGTGHFDADIDTVIVRVYDDYGTGSPQHISTSDDGTTVLLGVQWEFAKLDFRIEYERWDLRHADSDVLGIAVAYRF